MVAGKESLPLFPHALAEDIANRRASPGILVFTLSEHLIYMNQEALELNNLINREEQGKTANGILSPEVNNLCRQVRRLLNYWPDAKTWEQIKITHLVGNPKHPVLLSGVAIPPTNGTEDARILILMNEICHRKDCSVDHAKDCFKLTHREQAVVEQLIVGKTNKEIAKKLGISEQTTKEHIKRIMKKMKVSTRTGILAKIFRSEREGVS